MSAAWQISSTLTASTPCAANRSVAAVTMRSCTSRTRRSRLEVDPAPARTAVLAILDSTAYLTVTVNCTNRPQSAFGDDGGPRGDAVRLALRDRGPTSVDGDVRRRLLLGGARAGEGRRGGRVHACLLGRASFPRPVL